MWISTMSVAVKSSTVVPRKGFRKLISSANNPRVTEVSLSPPRKFRLKNKTTLLSPESICSIADTTRRNGAGARHYGRSSTRNRLNCVEVYTHNALLAPYVSTKSVSIRKTRGTQHKKLCPGRAVIETLRRSEISSPTPR